MVSCCLLFPLLWGLVWFLWLRCGPFLRVSCLHGIRVFVGSLLIPIQCWLLICLREVWTWLIRVHQSFSRFEVLSSRGDFIWSHSLREANQVANALAKFGISYFKHNFIFVSVPSFLSFLVWADVSITSFLHGF